MSDKFIILIMHWHLAPLKVQLKLLRLGLALRAYNPGQPRIPAGTPGGGQWTDGDPAGTDGLFDGARVVPVSDDGSSRYHVRLEEEEVRGHTLKEHVGKTDEEMFQRVQKSAWWNIISNGGIKRVGSFPSRETANDLVNRNLEQNTDLVDQVANGTLKRKFLEKRFGFKTGREAYSTNEGVIYMRDTYAVGVEIRHDPQSSRGYRVHTAYPRNDRD